VWLPGAICSVRFQVWQAAVSRPPPECTGSADVKLRVPGRVRVPAVGIGQPERLLDQEVAQVAHALLARDSAVRLHALASLIAQAQQLLPRAVHDARDQELTWTQIGELLNISAATAARRYRSKP
jgi:hypothetical protein